MAEPLRALAAGLELAVRFNPLAALLAATLAATLAGTRVTSHARIGWAVGVLLLGWLIGDGLRALALARDVVDSVGGLVGGPEGSEWLAIGTWALGSLTLGYAAPAWAGVFVGRRVTHGTGWLAAGATAAVTAAALIALAAIASA